ncbi:AAA family ATPase [Methylobacterium thuringiense]|uniref:AAA family ATPase n=1 Tax=Methylobacterium thuringiense TaxID=1003091 RepID=UPI002795E7C9|nr:AAA family ATPase [Methylobacterium thuringiense]
MVRPLHTQSGTLGGAEQFHPGASPPAPLPRQLNLGTVPPHRRWLLGSRLVRGENSVLAAPGGRAKSSIAVAWACSLSCGRSLVGERVYGGPKRVLYVSTEDSAEELNRRFYSAMIVHSLQVTDLGNIQVLGVDTMRLVLTAGSDKSPMVDQAGISTLARCIEAARADVVMLDPLGAIIPVGLNDNGFVAGLMGQLKALAVRRDFALLIIHHFKKGSDGSAEAVGGASAIVNHARAVFTVETMGERDGSAFGVMPSERWRVLRVIDLKVNLAPPATGKDWLYLASAILPNAAPPDYPNGESVQAVVCFKPMPIGTAGKLDAVSATRIEAEFIRIVRKAQDAGAALYVSKFGAKAAGISAAPMVLAEVIRSVTGRSSPDCAALAGSIMEDLMTRKLVAVGQVTTPNRHKRNGLVVGSNAPPNV